MKISHNNQLLFLITILACMACNSTPSVKTIVSGVTTELAQNRKAQISEVIYNLSFHIPDKISEPIAGNVQVNFSLSDAKNPVILDFRADASQVLQVKKGTETIPAQFSNDHIIIPSRFLENGRNSIEIEFVAGNLSLNRSEAYLYTLFVPDRASTAFPCFDQPNIKARYQLELFVPNDWEAVGNGAVEEMLEKDDTKQYRFSETAPISTYLFAFAAGRFQKISQLRNGREMNMFFRETDSIKVANNAAEVFDLHATALSWLEAYTGIPYPFQKFDFVLIPTFQYGGMEHVGNIFYKEPSLFLDPSATENQKLGRASLIAHETAHMWFGDLVTMDWFSDVWLKEVFANFMAAKIVNPSFPEINHDLRFLMAHQPAAYGEDRSEGSHPIQQQLENLKDAGTLYGRIIYQKAPVVMQQLEKLIGEEDFQKGLQEYLQIFSFDNASWDDLINILDKKTDKDLKNWSQVWVKEAGMPILATQMEVVEDKISSLSIEQIKQSQQGNYWTQFTEMVLIYTDSVSILPLQIEGAQTTVPTVIGYPKPKAILANGSKMSYGYFQLVDADKDYILDHVDKLESPLLRGAAWISLYEDCLNKKLTPKLLLEKIIRALPKEKESLNRQNLLSYINTLYWKFLTPDDRGKIAANLEKLLWHQMELASTTSSKSAFFKTYQEIAHTKEAIDRLFQIWHGEYRLKGLPLSEPDLTDLACQLAILNPEKADDILNQQIAAISNPDRQKRLQFIRPALSGDASIRDDFFESLKKAENRHYEPWVVDALLYLHHPLRAASAEKYIQPSLELMEEIQMTGDIFFPRRWISATLSGHQSKETAQIVREFLATRPDYPYRLKNKILMGGDLLFRVGEP